MRTFCYLLLVAILVALVAAFYFDVLVLSADRQANGYIVSLAVHTDRINAAVPVSDNKVHGRIASIESDAKSFTLTTDDRQMTFQVDTATSITGAMHGLHTGDRVAVTYGAKEGENLAHNVTVESKP